VAAAATKQASAFALQLDDAPLAANVDNAANAVNDDNELVTDPDLLRERLLLRSYATLPFRSHPIAKSLFYSLLLIFISITEWISVVRRKINTAFRFCFV
jgi:hypothetical protein